MGFLKLLADGAPRKELRQWPGVGEAPQQLPGRILSRSRSNSAPLVELETHARRANEQ